MPLSGWCCAVVEHNCASLVGLRGLVLRETANTLQLLTVENALKTLPKKSAVLCFAHRGKKLTLPML